MGFKEGHNWQFFPYGQLFRGVDISWLGSKLEDKKFGI